MSAEAMTPTIGEQSFCAALNKGVAWTQDEHEAWCASNSKSCETPITLRAALIEALILSESAFHNDRTPRACDIETLEAFGFDTGQSVIAGALRINWLTSDYARNFGKASAMRDAVVPYLQNNTANVPVILGDITLYALKIPISICIRGCKFRNADDTEDAELKFLMCEMQLLDLSGSQFAEVHGDYSTFHNVVMLQGVIAEFLEFGGATIHGDMSCMGSHIKGAKDTEGRPKLALNFGRSTVNGNVLLTRGFTAHSTVDFFHARVGGNFRLHGAKIYAPWKDFAESEDLDWRRAIDLDSCEIEEGLFFAFSWGDLKSVEVYGHIDLTNARCRVLNDAPLEEGWFAKGAHLILDGFRYESLGSRAPKNWKPNKQQRTVESGRLAWLKRQPPEDLNGDDFKPQPFEQLAKVLREMGHVANARSAASSKQWRMHLRPGVPFESKVFRGLILWPSGYGYHPQIPFYIGLGLLLFSLLIFASAYRQGFVMPAQPHAAIADISAELGATSSDTRFPDCLAVEATETVPPFHAFAYVVDTFVPLVDIDQESSWKPARTQRCDGDVVSLAMIDQVNPSPFFNVGPQTGHFRWVTGTIDSFVAWSAPRGFLLWLQWILMISGFAISALIAASLSGLIRRD